MGMLKWFNREKYEGLSEVLSAIRQELKSLQPTDSSDIVWNKSPNGMSAKLRGNNASSSQTEVEDSPMQTVSTYNGYFTIKMRTLGDGTKKIVVCDGATYDAEKGTSGDSVVSINGTYRKVPYGEHDIPAKNTFVCAKYVSLIDDPDKGDRCKILMIENLEDETGIVVIGEVRFTDNEPSVIQRHGTVATESTNGVLYLQWNYACDM